jgi:glycosyltransferase involved in cell wall biosynthesis
LRHEQVQDVKISIALASYNGEQFIRDQLDSFARQSRLPDEVVITDDGSTDGTQAAVAAFASSAPFPIQFRVNPRRLGYARNFERAIGLCAGELIFLSDQDDVWFRDKIATLCAAFDAHPHAMVVVNDQILTDGSLNHQGHTKLSNLRRLGIGPEGLIEGCCTAFRRSWADLVLPIPQEEEELVERRLQSHDRWINELAILLGVRHVVRKPLQYFRRTGANTTNWIVSEPHKTSLRDLMARRLPKAPIAAWNDRIRVLDGFARWIAANRDNLETVGINGCDAALKSIARERQGIARRAVLAVEPSLKRSVSVVSLWARGGYRYFHGWKSAVSDLLRSA